MAYEFPYTTTPLWLLLLFPAHFNNSIDTVFIQFCRFSNRPCPFSGVFTAVRGNVDLYHFCHNCGKEGHLIKDCRQKRKEGSSWESEGSRSTTETGRRSMKEIECYNCKEKGHIATRSPHKATFCAQMRPRPFSTWWKNGIV